MSIETPESKEWIEDPRVVELLEDRMDHKDYLIFRELNEDGRLSDTELAERVDLSRTAARRRRKQLQEDGILQIFALLVFKQADYSYAEVQITYDTSASADRVDEFIRTLLDDGLVYEVAECMGEHDLMIRVWQSSLDKINAHVRRHLHDNDVVDSYSVVPITNSYKMFHRDFTEDTADS
ncbi:Lrp/AsnC family transcriptional regulator [Halobaculum roseum]|uniref:Lrp/AsnC family transcriptional regulator n=1 Tax=Halobaculum roseum TaxID=2175149 RepID=A0ABD5MMR6_9EURY|nr:Lrp/AsnC family transcriptional regulator [Halobaculum roseum]QZY01895.1 Lrp/AsnC family transcriptional regulator [Halobaculum roseum]